MRNLALLIEVLDEAMRILPPTVPIFTKLKMYDAPILNLRGKKQMTTFTSDDREEAYKKMHEDIVPIPFAGWVNASPPHIVDSGASVMDKPVAWTDGKGNYFDRNSFFPVDDLTPLYTHPAKTLTDEEILQFQDKVPYTLGSDLIEFARAILRKAQEK